MAKAPIADPAKISLRPVDIESYEEEKVRRREEHQAKQAVLLECLDAEVAAQYEAKKERREYEIECIVRERDAKGRLATRKISGEVEAQDESEAWAKFCDKNRTWPSPRGANRKIIRVR